MTFEEKIEILSVDLLEQNRSLVDELKKTARRFKLEFGWHYLLDLTWILQQLGEIKGKRIMDAGAGTGVIQWFLAQQGAEVISVDRSSRALLPLNFRVQVRVEGLRSEDLLPAHQALVRNFTLSSKRNLTARVGFTRRILSLGRDLTNLARQPHSSGRVLIYNQDLANLADIQDDSLDAVVAVSALEHNTPEWLQNVIAEILRVLKPAGVLLATLTAGRDQDWWHTPSSGWCYTAATLRRLFDLPPEAPSNYYCYDDLFKALRNCAELQDNLASFYFQSGQNGMPWGTWDPQYQPVGIVKVKR